MKRFFEWIGLKEKIHHGKHIPPVFKEGQVWWCYTGENVGIEINGKSDLFTRPIFIFKKYDRYSFLGLPLSTKIKEGSWYTQTKFMGTKQIIVLSQGRVFDYRRLKDKIGEFPEHQIEIINIDYKQLHIK